jgi:hypothetical protein
VIPPLFPAEVRRPILPLAFCFAQRARAAADNLARVAADVLRLPLLDVNRVAVPPRIEASRLSKASICRRIETASSKAFRDSSMPTYSCSVACGKLTLTTPRSEFLPMPFEFRQVQAGHRNGQRLAGAA